MIYKNLITKAAQPFRDAVDLLLKSTEMPEELIQLSSPDAQISLEAHRDEVNAYGENTDIWLFDFVTTDLPKHVMQEFVQWLKRSDLLVEEKQLKFETFQYADIQINHLPYEDILRIENQKAPNLIADYEYGSFFHVPSTDGEEGTPEEIIRRMCEPMSEEFIHLMLELHRHGIMYVRFDQDGYEVEGAPVFDW